MSTTAVDVQVQSYLAALRAALKDLPNEEREDLVEDLEQHLAEVLADGDGSLVERLGPPEAYAAELLASAGIEPASGSRVRRVVDAVTSMRAVTSIRGFLSGLGPGWWVLRGFLAAAAVVMLGQDIAGYFDPLGVSASIVLLGLVTIPLSVVTARYAVRNSGWRTLSIVVTTGVIALTGIAVLDVDTGIDMLFRRSYEELGINTGALTHGDGQPIANICAYDLDGRPLKSVLLFDQNGRPIVDVSPATGSERELAGRVYPRDGHGRRIVNAYPHRLMIRDPNTGELEQLRCAPELAARENYPLPGHELPTP